MVAWEGYFSLHNFAGILLWCPHISESGWVFIIRILMRLNKSLSCTVGSDKKKHLSKMFKFITINEALTSDSFGILYRVDSNQGFP